MSPNTAHSMQKVPLNFFDYNTGTHHYGILSPVITFTFVHDVTRKFTSKMDSDEIQEGPASLIATHIQIESMAGSNTIVNDTTSAEPPPQPQQKRFSFYDAKAVGGIVVDTSESSIYKTKDEEINSTRHQFYDTKRVITHNTLPNTDVNLQDLAQQTGPEGRRQKSREENISVPLFSDDIDSTGSMIEKKK